MACGRQLYSVTAPGGGRHKVTIVSSSSSSSAQGDNRIMDIFQPICANTGVGLGNYLAVPAPRGQTQGDNGPADI